jgi:hypothetical protein
MTYFVPSAPIPFMPLKVIRPSPNDPSMIVTVRSVPETVMLSPVQMFVNWLKT